MVRRLLPSPWLSVGLLGLWLLLNGSLAPGQWLIGALLAIAVPIATRGLRPAPVRLRRPLALARLIIIVIFDVIESNLAVAAGVLHLGRPPQPGFVVVPLAVRDANALAALAIITSVVPGTVWLELSIDRERLLLHVFDLPDAPAFISYYKSRYERL
ncbi:MAG: Na+/H+ antiporter subunit E, partial [Lautropia sp.]